MRFEKVRDVSLGRHVDVGVVKSREDLVRHLLIALECGHGIARRCPLVNARVALGERL